jgi:hypothetical protein
MSTARSLVVLLLLLLTAEYRWDAWWALDGALFVDAGKVAADRRDLNLRDLDVSYGVGFRVHSNPLDSFTIERTAAGTELLFDNAAARLRAAQPGAAYKAQWFALDNGAGTERAAGPAIDLSDPRLAIPDAAWGPADAAGFRYAVASMKTIHASHPNWAAPVVVTVREQRGTIEVVGIERPAGSERER